MLRSEHFEQRSTYTEHFSDGNSWTCTRRPSPDREGSAGREGTKGRRNKAYTASSLVPSFIRPPREVIRMVTKQFSRRKFEDKGHFDELHLQVPAILIAR